MGKCSARCSFIAIRPDENVFVLKVVPFDRLADWRKYHFYRFTSFFWHRPDHYDRHSDTHKHYFQYVLTFTLEPCTKRNETLGHWEHWMLTSNGMVRVHVNTKSTLNLVTRSYSNEEKTGVIQRIIWHQSRADKTAVRSVGLVGGRSKGATCSMWQNHNQRDTVSCQLARVRPDKCNVPHLTVQTAVKDAFIFVVSMLIPTEGWSFYHDDDDGVMLWSNRGMFNWFWMKRKFNILLSDEIGCDLNKSNR